MEKFPEIKGLPKDLKLIEDTLYDSLKWKPLSEKLKINYFENRFMENIKLFQPPETIEELLEFRKSNSCKPGH